MSYESSQYKVEISQNSKGTYRFLVYKKKGHGTDEIRSAMQWRKRWFDITSETVNLPLEALSIGTIDDDGKVEPKDNMEEISTLDKITSDCVLYAVAKILNK